MTHEHLILADEIHSKEPSEKTTFTFDFTDSSQVAADATINSVATTPAPSVTPAEQLNRISIAAILDEDGDSGGEFVAGEIVDSSGGGTGIVEADTADGASELRYISLSGVIASGESLTGRKSGAATSAVSGPTKESDGVQISGTPSGTGKKVNITTINGLRPIQNRPWREYLCVVYVNWSDGQILAVGGRLRVGEEAKPDNPVQP